MVKTLFDFEYTFCYYSTGDWKLSSPYRCNLVGNKLFRSSIPSLCEAVFSFLSTGEHDCAAHSVQSAPVLAIDAVPATIPGHPYEEPGILLMSILTFPALSLSNVTFAAVECAQVHTLTVSCALQYIEWQSTGTSALSPVARC